MKDWKILQDEMIDGHRIVLRYNEWGKGRSKIRKWEILRDDVKVGYAVNPQDAVDNFARAAAGYGLNFATGYYEKIEDKDGE